MRAAGLCAVSTAVQAQTLTTFVSNTERAVDPGSVRDIQVSLGAPGTQTTTPIAIIIRAAGVSARVQPDHWLTPLGLTALTRYT